jgi:hypothetical protein
MPKADCGKHSQDPELAVIMQEQPNAIYTDAQHAGQWSSRTVNGSRVLPTITTGKIDE